MPKEIFVPKKHQVIYMADHLTKEEKRERLERLLRKRFGKQAEDPIIETRVAIPPLPSLEEILAADKETEEFLSDIRAANSLAEERRRSGEDMDDIETEKEWD